jgi:PPP family 3-phenylpropionic acid transporter
MKPVWPFTFNFLIFAGFAFAAPFLVLYYQSVGFSGAEIGLLTGVTPLVTLVAAPFWTGLADAKRRHRLILSVALVVATAVIFVFPFFNTFAPIFLIAILFSAFFAPVTSFADSATMFMLADRKDMYGRVRLGGTLGFGVAGSLAGVIVQSLGLNFAFWGCALLLLLAMFAGQKLTHNTVGASASTAQGVRTLLSNRRWLLFMTLAFAGGLAIAATNTYLFPFLRELGATESTMGLALTLGTVSEIPVLFFGNRLLKRFKPYGLLALAMLITGARLMAFAAADTPALALAIQLFNGLTFPAMWVAGVAYADEHAPAGLNATAQGMFGAMVFGFGAAVGGFIGGPLLESVGGRGLFLIFGIIVLVVAAIVALVQRRLPAELQTAPTVAMN